MPGRSIKKYKIILKKYFLPWSIKMKWNPKHHWSLSERTSPAHLHICAYMTSHWFVYSTSCWTRKFITFRKFITYLGKFKCCEKFFSPTFQLIQIQVYLYFYLYFFTHWWLTVCVCVCVLGRLCSPQVRHTCWCFLNGQQIDSRQSGDVFITGTASKL